MKSQHGDGTNRQETDDTKGADGMSTKMTLKHHSDKAAGGGWFHLYREGLDPDVGVIYLELDGVECEAESAGVNSWLGRVVVRIPDQWASKLGMLDNPR
jgi:hypothetical protein